VPGPSPGSYRTMLRIAGGDPTSPRKRGEVKKGAAAVRVGAFTARRGSLPLPLAGEGWGGGSNE
jgi:hypothetical protein